MEYERYVELYLKAPTIKVKLGSAANSDRIKSGQIQLQNKDQEPAQEQNEKSATTSEAVVGENPVKLEGEVYKECGVADPENTVDCVVCLETFGPKDIITALNCNPKHFFHKDCANEWLNKQPECPLCRADFTKDIERL